MSSNSARAKQQMFAIPVACAVIAAVLWPVSYVAAQSTGWLSTGTFVDFWTGALAVSTFLGAAAATIGAVGGGLDGLYRWTHD